MTQEIRDDHYTIDDLAAALTQTCQILANEPTPPMPDAVFDRLIDVIRTESQRRSTGESEAEEVAARTAAAKRTDLGSFGQNPAASKPIGAWGEAEPQATRLASPPCR